MFVFVQILNYGGDIPFICLEAQTLAKKQSSFKILFVMRFKVFFIMQSGHRHCMPIIAFILNNYM